MKLNILQSWFSLSELMSYIFKVTNVTRDFESDKTRSLLSLSATFFTYRLIMGLLDTDL